MFKHRDVPIEIDQMGNFIAKVGSVEVSTPTLKACQEAIDKEVTHTAKAKVLNLKVIGILKEPGRWDSKNKPAIRLQRAVLVGINRTTRDLMFEGVSKGYEMESVMADTPKAEAKLKEYLEAKAAFNAIEDHIHNFQLGKLGYGRVAAEDYEKLLAQVEEQHMKCKYEH